jgi:hypothetical protein
MVAPAEADHRFCAPAAALRGSSAIVLFGHGDRRPRPMLKSSRKAPATRAANPAAGLGPVPPQFFDRQPHRFLPIAFLPINPPFDQSLLSVLGSCHEDLVELILDPPIDPWAF